MFKKQQAIPDSESRRYAKEEASRTARPSGPSDTTSRQLDKLERFLYKITMDMCVRQPERNSYMQRPVSNKEFASAASKRYLAELSVLIEEAYENGYQARNLEIVEQIEQAFTQAKETKQDKESIK